MRKLGLWHGLPTLLSDGATRFADMTGRLDMRDIAVAYDRAPTHLLKE